MQMYWAVLFTHEGQLQTLTADLPWLAPRCFLQGSVIHSTQVRQSWESTTQIAFQENQCEECGWPTAPGSHFLGISHSIYTKSMLSLGHNQAMTKQGVLELGHFCPRPDPSIKQALSWTRHQPGPHFLKALSYSGFLPSLSPLTGAGTSCGLRLSPSPLVPFSLNPSQVFPSINLLYLLSP